MAHLQQSGTPVNLSGSGAVSLVAGSLLGFYVNSTTAGTVVLRNGGAAGTAISGTITPAIGWHRFPAYTPAGCYATFANALDATFFFAAG